MNEDAFLALGGVLLAAVCAGALVGLLIVVFFLLTMQKALSRCAPRNRLMEPGMVWLNLIPCVNLVWQFMIAVRVPDSLKNEFRDRGQDDGSDYGRSLGLTYCILGIVANIVSQGSRAAARNLPEVALGVSAVAMLMVLVALVAGILFWVKIAGYSSRLAQAPGPRNWDDRRFDDDGDDDDDRGPVKPKPETFKEGDPGRYK